MLENNNNNTYNNIWFNKRYITIILLESAKTYGTLTYSQIKIKI